MLKEEVVHSNDASGLDINQEYNRPSYFSDISWAYYGGGEIKVRGIHEMRSLILNASKVQKMISELAAKDKNPQPALKEQTQKAHEIINQMLCELKMPMVRVLGWGLRKI